MQQPPRGGGAGGQGQTNAGHQQQGSHGQGQQRSFSNAHNRKGSGNTSGAAASAGPAGPGGAAVATGSARGSGSPAPTSKSNTTQVQSSQASKSTSEPAGPSNATPSSSLSLSSLIGAELKLTLSIGAKDKERLIVQGQLWCYDPAYGSLVLTTPSTTPGQALSYRIVRLFNITQVAVVQPASPTASNATSPSTVSGLSDVPLKAIDINRVQEREAEGLREERKRIAAEPPPGVSLLGKAVYDALAKTLPVRWSNTGIVVMDEVLVEPPYESSEKCIKSNNLTRKERVMKVLLGETTKLQQTRPELWS